MANLDMVVWDVQHGNAIYIRTPNGKHLVFDLGIGDYSGRNESFSPLVKIAQDYGVRTINFLMITHPHLDHIDDILNIDRFSLNVLHRPGYLTRELVMANVRDRDRPKFEKYFELNDRYTASIEGTLNDTSVPSNYGGVEFSFFNTPLLPTDNLNNHSTITVLKYLGGKIVICGDNECQSTEALMQQDRFKEAIEDCDILIAPHHGRESAYYEDFLDHANPLISIISDGSICDTSANPRYSGKSRGWQVYKKSSKTYCNRRLLTTNSDGEVYIKIASSADPSFARTLAVAIE